MFRWKTVSATLRAQSEVLESECFITAEGREWLRRPDRFYFLCPLHGRLSPQHFSDLLRIIDERPGIPVKMVVDLACSDGFSISINEIIGLSHGYANMA